MKKIRGFQTIDRPLYDNCQMLTPDGTLMAFVGRTKAEWYISRNLASIVSEEPFKFRLKFSPKHAGHAVTGVVKEYFLTPKENVCVVCGTRQDLTRHHVVPYAYRRFKTLNNVEEKNNPRFFNGLGSYDVLALCADCHHRYEVSAMQLKKVLAEEFDCPITGSGVVFDGGANRLAKYARTLLRYGENIPADKKEQMLDFIREQLGKDEISEGDLRDNVQVRATLKLDDYATHAKLVYGRVKDDFNSFVRRWRRHFLKVMQPQYLPQGWKPDVDIYD